MDYVEATCPSCKRLISIDTSAPTLTCANCHKALRLVRGRVFACWSLLGEAGPKFPWDRPKGLGDFVIKPIIPPLDPMGASRLPQIPSILPDEPLSRSGIDWPGLPVPQVITGALCGYS